MWRCLIHPSFSSPYAADAHGDNKCNHDYSPLTMTGLYSNKFLLYQKVCYLVILSRF